MNLPSTRKQPYTAKGVSRVPCVKCGKPSEFQWRICSTDKHTAVCRECDIEINRMVSEWAFGRRVSRELIKAYVARIEGGNE